MWNRTIVCVRWSPLHRDVNDCGIADAGAGEQAHLKSLTEEQLVLTLDVRLQRFPDLRRPPGTPEGVRERLCKRLRILAFDVPRHRRLDLQSAVVA